MLWTLRFVFCVRFPRLGPIPDLVIFNTIFGFTDCLLSDRGTRRQEKTSRWLHIVCFSPCGSTLLRYFLRYHVSFYLWLIIIFNPLGLLFWVVIYWFQPSKCLCKFDLIYKACFLEVLVLVHILHLEMAVLTICLSRVGTVTNHFTFLFLIRF